MAKFTFLLFCYFAIFWYLYFAEIITLQKGLVTGVFAAGGGWSLLPVSLEAPGVFCRPARSRTFAFTPPLPARRTHPCTEAKYLHVRPTAGRQPLRSILPRQ